MPNTLEELEIVVKGNIKDVVAKLEELKEKIQVKVNSEMEKMQPSVNKISNSITSSISKSANQFDFLGRQIDIQKKKVDELRKKMQEYNRYNEIQAKLKSGKLGAQEYIDLYSEIAGKSTPKNVGLQLESAELQLDKLRAKAQSTAGDIVSPFKNALSKISGLFSKVSSAMWSSMKNAVSKIGNGIKKLFSPVTKLTNRFKRLATVMLFRNIIRQAIAGFQDLAQYSSSFNQSMSSMQAGLLQARNSIATAFAPVLQALVPIINAVSSAITELFTKIAQLTSALFGNSTTFTKAKKVTTDYAKSVGKTTQANKGMLASFDELQVISPQSGNDSGMPSAGEMFEEANVESPILEFTNKIKEAIKNGDWYGVGVILGDKLNEAIDGIKTKDLGTKLGKKINNAFSVALSFLRTVKWSELGKTVATNLNNLFSTVNFERVGNTLGAGLNAILYTAEGFITNFDWSLAGKSISDAINGFFEEFDFATLAQTISNLVAGIYNMLATTIENTKWDKVADGIYEFFKNIKWEDLVKSMARFFGSALGGFSRFVIEFLIINPAEDLANYFYEKMEECGGNAWEGFKKGIIDALYNLGKFIVEDIFEPFINGFKNAFGINSPSTVMAEMGTYIVEGLFDGISGLIDIILTPFKNIIAEIQKVWTNVVAWFDMHVVKPIGNFFGGLWNGIKTGASKLADVIDGKVIKPIVSTFKGMYNSLMGIMEGLINGFIGMINGFIRGINRAIELINEIPGVSLPTIRQMDKVSIPRLAQGNILTEETLFIGGEYPNAKSNPEIVAPQSLMYETNMKANIPVMNAIEEMTDTLVDTLKNMGVYAEFDYDKLRVGLNNANYRAGEKLYGV